MNTKEIINNYKKGATIKELSKIYKIEAIKISNLLKDNGITVKRGRRPSVLMKQWNPNIVNKNSDRDNKICELYKSNFSIKTIAETFNITKQRIFYILREKGVERNRISETKNFNAMFDADDCIIALTKVTIKIGKPPTVNEYIRNRTKDMPSASHIRYKVGKSWSEMSSMIHELIDVVPLMDPRYNWIKNGVRSKVSEYHIFTSDPYYLGEWVVDCKAEFNRKAWRAYPLRHWYNAKPEILN